MTKIKYKYCYQNPIFSRDPVLRRVAWRGQVADGHHAPTATTVRSLRICGFHWKKVFVHSSSTSYILLILESTVWTNGKQLKIVLMMWIISCNMHGRYGGFRNEKDERKMVYFLPWWFMNRNLYRSIMYSPMSNSSKIQRMNWMKYWKLGKLCTLYRVWGWHLGYLLLSIW